MEVKVEENDFFPCNSPEITESAEVATIGLLPEKSKLLYQREYEAFIKWSRQKNIDNFSEIVLLEYFLEKAQKYKASSLWTYYSMLRATITLKHNIDISKYSKLIELLKRKSENYKPTKSNILTREQIETFIREAPDDIFLMTKVALILGISGACRREELTTLTVDDIEDLGAALVVKIGKSRGNISRTFIVVNNNEDFLGIIRKYATLRPKVITHKRFFLCFKNGRCSTQPVGKNTFGSIPTKIAEYLKLPNPSSYTGHCLRRSSATLLANSSGNFTDWNYPQEWKTSTVSEERIQEPLEDKPDTAKIIFGNDSNITLPSTSKINYCQQDGNMDPDQPNHIAISVKGSVPYIQLNNCTNCKVDVHIKLE